MTLLRIDDDGARRLLRAIKHHLLFEFVWNVFARIAVIDSRINVLHRRLMLKYRRRGRLWRQPLSPCMRGKIAQRRGADP
jgi:hypothetical protein